MAWKRYPASSGHDTLDNEELEADAAGPLLRRLKARFGPRFQRGDRAGLTFDAAAFEFRIDGAPLTLGWDIWSGLFIMANDASGDAVLKEIEKLLTAGEQNEVI